MCGSIGKTKVLVMIDSGATHNFISPTAVMHARLKQENSSMMKIKVGTGIVVTGSGDFIVLEPGSVDIILGVQWLRTGKCEVDWEYQTLSYSSMGMKYTLQGDQSIACKEITADMVSVFLRLQSLQKM